MQIDDDWLDCFPLRKKKKHYYYPSPSYDMVMRDVLQSIEQSIEEEAVEFVEEVDNAPLRERRRSCKKASNDDPRQSNWFHNYVDNANMSPTRLKKFRRRFRLPYDEFVKLKDSLNEDELFTRWHDGNTDTFGARATPIALLLLGSLRYLGRGLTFDDIEEATNVSQETHRQFFHKFIFYGSTTLYTKYRPADQVSNLRNQGLLLR